MLKAKMKVISVRKRNSRRRIPWNEKRINLMYQAYFERCSSQTRIIRLFSQLKKNTDTQTESVPLVFNVQQCIDTKTGASTRV